ncbi:hypothetical protein [Microbacterium sp. SMR1]|uniref:hypothetical protein n=1 Tax=Microbacterium sp. SMR1 TaxID=1497340 RepID=UPI0011BDBE91|nr:hypothetical protein [Microbacterium sp. SMR1]
MTWSDLLDGLEAELAADTSPAQPWHAPANLGPIPAHLEDRARAILRAQADRARALHAEQDALRGHLDALDRIPQSQPDAVYLDVDG